MMDTSKLVVGQRVWMRSGKLFKEATVESVTEEYVDVEPDRVGNEYKYFRRFDKTGTDIGGNGGPDAWDPRPMCGEWLTPWELVERNTNEYRMGAEADNSHILTSDPDPFPAMLWTGNLLSDCWRYVRVTAAVSWKLFRRTLGRIAH